MTVEHLRLADIHRLEARFDTAAGPGHPASGLKAGVTSPGAVAVAGVDGYLFISNGANRWEQQYFGEQTPPRAWITAWNDLLARRQAEAAARGLTLLNLVAPEKQVIYPEKRWPGDLPKAERRPLKLIQTQLDPAARLIYPEAALLATKAAAPAYHRHNSHWTISGCAAVVDTLLAALDTPARMADLAIAAERLHAAQDLSIHLFDTPPPEDFLWPTHCGERVDDNRHIELTGRNSGASYRLRNPSAPDPRKVVVFGDSYAYGAGVVALLSAAFAEVLILWSKAVDWELVTRERPAIVVWESAERFLASLPAA
jgi:hypothetical protein